MTRFVHPLVAYAAPATKGAGAIRTIVGICLCVAIMYGFVQLARLGMSQLLFGDSAPLAMGGRGPIEARDPRAPLGVLMILGAFMAVWPALWLVLPLVHRRRAATLFGPSGRLDWRQFRFGLAVSAAVGAAAWGPLIYAHGDALGAVPSLQVWAIWALIAAPLIFVQCTAEELVFRGYLLQQFAARSLSVLGWSVLPSILFGLAHPSETGLFGISWFHVVFGLIMAAVTSRTANLGLAIGLHYGNNLLNLLLISPVHMASGLALLKVPQDIDITATRTAYLAAMFIGAAAFMGYMDLRLIREARRRKRAEAEAEAGAGPRPDAAPAPAAPRPAPAPAAQAIAAE